MGQLRTEWLSLAMKDLAMFHICLSHYAGNYGLAKLENDPAEALRLRMKSMRIVNQRLDEAEAALTDGTLGTVASLSSYEVTTSSSRIRATSQLVLTASDISRLRMDLCWQSEHIFWAS